MTHEPEKRYCPTCGISVSSIYCPDCGAVTVVRLERSTAQLPLRPGDHVNSRYEITAVIGRGGFGVVYSARHLVSEQELAIKILLKWPKGTLEEAKKRFQKEAHVLAKLNHPNTVRVFDVGYTEAGDLFVAMELLRGPNLEQVFADMRAHDKVMTEAQAIDVVVPVLGSLAEAHALDLVHRDMKPANIALTHVPEEPFVVKVLDFGIVHTQNSKLTINRAALGTPTYMSPEQCLSRPVDGRSDLYSVGIILFEALCGRLPYRAESAIDIMYQQMETPLPDLRMQAPGPVSDGMVAIVKLALAKRPDRRFASVQEMRSALQSTRQLLWKNTPATRLTDLLSDHALRSARSFSIDWGAQVSDALQQTTAGPRMGRRKTEKVGKNVFDRDAASNVGDAIANEVSSEDMSGVTEQTFPPFDLEETGPLPDAVGAAPAQDNPFGDWAMKLPSLDKIEAAIQRQKQEHKQKERPSTAQPTVRELLPGRPRKRPRKNGKMAPVVHRPEMAPPSAADQINEGDKRRPKLSKKTTIGSGLSPAAFAKMQKVPGEADTDP